MRPCSVQTPVMRPAARSSPRTAQCSTTRTPRAMAPVTSSGTATQGSARASEAVNRPPGQSACAPCRVRVTSARLSIRVSTPLAWAWGSQASNPSISLAVLARYMTPVWRKPSASPNSCARLCQIRRLSTMIGSSAGSRPCWRIQPQLRLLCSAAIRPFSHSVTVRPRSARCQAVITPMTPPPMMTTSQAAGGGPGKRSGLSGVIGNVMKASRPGAA